MRVRVAVPENHVVPSVIEPVLEGVTKLNEAMIKSGDVPPFEARPPSIRWRPENLGDEHFDHAGTVLQRGWGDCDDLAPWKAASLRASGEDPGATTRLVRSTPSTYHAIVQRSDGRIDDPSVECGMVPRRAGVIGGDDGESIHILACDPHDGRTYEGALLPTVGPLTLNCGPSLAFRKRVVGWEARCDVPISGAHRHYVHAHWAHNPRRHHRIHGIDEGECGPSIACIGSGPTASESVHASIVGALACGEASGTLGELDKYKLLAVQAVMSGMSATDVTHLVASHMLADAQRATGKESPGPQDIQGFFDDVGKFFKDAAKVAAPVIKVVAPIAGGIFGGPAGAAAGMALGTLAGNALDAAAQGADVAAGIEHLATPLLQHSGPNAPRPAPVVHPTVHPHTGRLVIRPIARALQVHPTTGQTVSPILAAKGYRPAPAVIHPATGQVVHPSVLAPKTRAPQPSAHDIRTLMALQRGGHHGLMGPMIVRF